MPAGSADLDLKTITDFVKLGGGLIGGLGAVLTVISMLGIA